MLCLLQGVAGFNDNYDDHNYYSGVGEDDDCDSGVIFEFQDLIDITLRRMDHDRDGRISFSDFSTTVQVHLEKGCDGFPKAFPINISSFPGGAFTDGSFWTLSPKQQGWGRVYQVGWCKFKFHVFRMCCKTDLCFTLEQKFVSKLIQVLPLSRKVLDGKPDGVSYYD